jgi:4-hydroxybenzoate polyprenyltransferase
MKSYLSLIKFSHTIFALPFALLGFTLGTIEKGEGVNWLTLLLVLFCMVFARSAAMAFNRYIDRDFDILNKRTATREIPAGVIQPRSALLFVVMNVLLFVGTTWFINSLCFYLSPIALLVILGYSYSKRFTALCHFILGLGLSFAPIGAYLAVTGSFALIPVLYSIVVLCWVSGFDIIYAMQDKSFDEAHDLHSVPAFLGLDKALLLSSFLHVVCALLVLYTSYQISLQIEHLGWLHWLGAAVFIGLLIYQHLLVKPNDLSKVDMAFFTTNGFASVLLCTFIIVDIFL